jgi:osmotically-inducible protein OsmY
MKTDTQIQLDVIAELHYETTINEAQIGVSVEDGIVTLTGNVEHYYEKYHAEKATQKVSGVRGIAMELEVKLPGYINRSDSDIAHAIDNIISWSSLLSKDNLHIKVEKGWVTLTGHVKWHHQKAMLNSSITHLLGVVGISDQLSIKKDLTGSVIKSDIVAALKRRALSDAKNIVVNVKDGEVTLTGQVHSWNERALVKHATWSNTDVINVIDKLSISSS